MKAKKIIIAGGTGFIGQSLVAKWGKENEIVVLSRQLDDQASNLFGHSIPGVNGLCRVVKWDGANDGPWVAELEGADLLINLAGRSVNCRYNEANKRVIFDSRTLPTIALGKAIAGLSRPPALWINASSATIYRHALDRPMDEYSGEYHDDFSVQVCKRWEEAFFSQKVGTTRKVALRTAITLGDGGVMVPYLNLVKWGLGGKQGNGNQLFSWIHMEDLARSMEWIFEHNEMQGVYNCSSPNPVSNEVFMRTLRKVCGVKIGLPAMEWMLAIGARLVGTEPELLLKSRWVLPTRLMESGFVFRFGELESAFREIVERLPRRRYRIF
ncbi:TIGR01777 family oxidoreductase [Flavihumibacter rivuli]|uniref:TIGR01777 family oxidoreductase n=1 Tax=Flavihumibacter rivuli TaxID=2838156 RepID=UPI001BDF1E39|nr:TIGR01777 family oxidoreductase [Flavihumibacter rivuli]ULQ56489.1 TIGR01777 family oxidoreductase [Flavihumibacter rivuli]